MKKDQALLNILDRLRLDFGDGAYQFVDHWDGDLCAVGIARNDVPRQLVYITVWKCPEGEVAVSLESPAETSEDLYDGRGTYEHCSYSELRELIGAHLAIKPESQPEP